MNVFTSDPAAAGAVARQVIEERVRDAENRRTVHAVRVARRAERRADRRAGRRAETYAGGFVWRPAAAGRHTLWRGLRLPRLARRSWDLGGTSEQGAAQGHGVALPPEGLN